MIIECKTAARNLRPFNMSLRHRRFLLIIFIFLFLIIGAGVIYYTQGYRIDFSNFSITKTGAVSVEANVTGFTISIGKETYQDKSGLFKNSTLISNVIPGKYRILIKKDGYFDYEKNVDVLPSQVVRLLNVHMVPAVSTSTVILNGVKGNGIVDVDQSNNVLTYDSAKSTYYLYDLSSPSTAGINMNQKIAGLTKQKATSLWFYPQTDNTFITLTSKGLYKMDMTAKTMTAIQEGAVSDVRIDGNNIYMIVSNPGTKPIAPASSVAPSRIVIFDLVLGSKITEFMLPFQASQIADLDAGNNLVSLLLTNGSLYLYDNSGKQISQIAHLARRMAVSDDKTKVYFQDTDGKTFVYLLDEELIALDSKQYSTLKLQLVDASHITGIYWYPDSFHLMLVYPDQIYLAEVTSKDPNNRFPIIKMSGVDFYSQNNKMIYNLDAGILSTLDITKI